MRLPTEDAFRIVLCCFKVMASVRQFLWYGHNLEIVFCQKIEDGFTLGRIGDILLDTAHGIERRCAALIDVAVALGYVVDCLLREFCPAQDKCVHPIVSNRVVSHHDIGRYIAVDSASTLYEHPLADSAMLMHHSRRGENAVIADFAVACYLHRITNYAPVAYLGIVADMRLRHDERVVADFGAFIGTDAQVDDYVLANFVVVAYLHEGAVAFPTEILRLGTYHSAFIHLVVIAHTGATEQRRVGPDMAVFANDYIFIDKGEGIYYCSLSYLGFRIDECEGAYLLHIFKF